MCKSDLQSTELRESGWYRVHLTNADREDNSQRILPVSFSLNTRRLSSLRKGMFGVANVSKQEPQMVCVFCCERKAQMRADNLISLGLH